MKNKLTTPIAILIGLGLVAFAIYLGLTIEFRLAEKGCKQAYPNKEHHLYEFILSDCIGKKLNSKN